MLLLLILTNFPAAIFAFKRKALLRTSTSVQSPSCSARQKAVHDLKLNLQLGLIGCKLLPEGIVEQRKQRIILIQDDPYLVETRVAILERHGYTVEVVQEKGEKQCEELFCNAPRDVRFEGRDRLHTVTWLIKSCSLGLIIWHCDVLAAFVWLVGPEQVLCEGHF